jgi:subtilisin-like proprotein convertase family protein
LDWTIDEAASSAPSAAPFEAVAVNPGLLLSAPARTTPARLADSPYVVLYDQTDNVGVNGFPSQNFETVNNAYDNAGADDFIIPAGDGSWTIESVDVIGVYSAGGGPTPSVDVNIYADNAGLPGTLVYSAPGVVPASDVGGDLGITLLAPAVLPSGHYWVSVIANMNFTPNGQWFWNTRTVQANNPYAWQNPGNGFGTGCVTWSPGAGTCGVGGGVEPDALFRLNGTIGGGGGGGCSAPSDIPWVSVSPASGTTTPGGGVPVDVTFDSTGLSIGVYTGTLCINSNDPVTPLVEVPVELTVTSGSGGGTVTQVFTNTTPVAIPTGPGVVTSTIVVAGANSYLYDLNMTTFIQHTFAADMDITIMSPAGTVVTLSSDNGTGNDNVFNGTVWDDSANPAGQVPYTTNNGLVTDHVYVNLTLASPLVPEETFGAFIGENPNGTWVITISDDLAGDGGSLDSWSLEITSGAAPSTSSQSFSNITPTPIPTGPAVASAVITVTGMTGSILDLNLTTFIQHTFAADMDITLMSPAGTVVTLSSDNGTSNDNVFNGTVWDDSADPDGQVPYTTNNGMVTDNAYVNLTLASPLTPEESMAAFNGEDPNGVWTITISDDLAGDGGSLDSWTLDITTAQ